jgi:hypothetical protein
MKVWRKELSPFDRIEISRSTSARIPMITAASP